jgi:hypothetical protein
MVFRTRPCRLNALALWADPARSWGSLYRPLEEIERYLGKKVNQVGLCSAGERKLFKQTANSAAAAGLGARHPPGPPGNAPPPRSLTLSEGAGFIERLLMAVGRGAGSSSS